MINYNFSRGQQQSNFNSSIVNNSISSSSSSSSSVIKNGRAVTISQINGHSWKTSSRSQKTYRTVLEERTISLIRMFSYLNFSID